MKKILIISYFYTPCNLTAAQRVNGWAKYLSEYGYYPIVVTRNWDIPIVEPEDVLRSSGEELKIIKHKTHEIHYLPYMAGIRDKVFTQLKGTRLQKLSKIFTFIELIAENFTTLLIPHKNLYFHSKKLLESDPALNYLIISGNPFNQFLFGYKLHKKLGVKWIADYRDDWNTSDLDDKPNASSKFINRLQIKSEKKWVGSAGLITSISSHYVEKITQFVNCSGKVILNGYDIEIPEKEHTSSEKVFKITYNGSLYQSQPIELLLDALKKIISDFEDKIEIEMHFPGLSFDESQAKRVREYTTSIKDCIHIYPRMDKENVLKHQLESDLLIMITHQKLKGIPSSKLFEYIGLKKPIIVFPNDHDIVEEIVSETKSGFVLDSSKEIYDKLYELIYLKLKGQKITTNFNEKAIEKYSRKHQTKRLAEILDSLK